MQILERGSDISAAQAEFTRVIRSHASEAIPVTIGFQSGSTDARVHWLPSLGFWAFFGEPPHEKSPGDRYWNIFGLGKPSGSVSIACEINPPKDGLNRRVGGAFARDISGRVWLVHRGNFNASGRIPFRFTRSNFRWPWQSAQDGRKHSEVMVMDALDSPSLLQRLQEFLLEVERFKQIARPRPWA